MLTYNSNKIELAGDKKGDEAEAAPADEDPGVIEARREEQERRRNKYAKMEQQREKVRVGIREKVGFNFFSSLNKFIFKQVFSFQYNIKKPEENVPIILPDVDGSLNAKKKTPAQLQINPDDDGTYIRLKPNHYL